MGEDKGLLSRGALVSCRGLESAGRLGLLWGSYNKLERILVQRDLDFVGFDCGVIFATLDRN